MKKWFAGGAVLAVGVVAAAWLAWSPAATAQTRVAPPVIALDRAAAIGVGVRDVTQEDADTAKLAQPTGAFVESVREGSPAQKAGVQAGDIVIEFDGERVRSVRHFTRLVQESAPGRSVPIVVMRGTSRQTFTLVPEATDMRSLLPESFPRELERQLGELRRNLPREFSFRIDPDRFPRGDFLTSGRTLGVTVTPLTAQLAEYFGVTQGALVSSVESNSPAAEAGVRAGDVITAVAGRNVTNARDITAAIRSAAPGDAVDISVTRERKQLMLKATIPDRRNTSGRSGLPV